MSSAPPQRTAKSIGELNLGNAWPFSSNYGTGLCTYAQNG